MHRLVLEYWYLIVTLSMYAMTSGRRIHICVPVSYTHLDVYKRQDLDSFLHDVDMVVLLVGHDEIKEHMDELKGKIVLDTRHICFLDGVYRL